MPNTRLVHDIILLKNRQHAGKVAVISFIQHGTVEDGWKYEVVCPFCAETVHKVDDPDDALSTEELYAHIYVLTTAHIKAHCTASGYRLRVEKAKRPLGTERIIKES